jgi:hypothetical protein
MEPESARPPEGVSRIAIDSPSASGAADDDGTQRAPDRPVHAAGEPSGPGLEEDRATRLYGWLAAQSDSSAPQVDPPRDEGESPQLAEVPEEVGEDHSADQAPGDGEETERPAVVDGGTGGPPDSGDTGKHVAGDASDDGRSGGDGADEDGAEQAGQDDAEAEESEAPAVPDGTAGAEDSESPPGDVLAEASERGAADESVQSVDGQGAERGLPDRDLEQVSGPPDRSATEDANWAGQSRADTWDQEDRHEHGDLGPDWVPMPETSMWDSFGCDDVALSIREEIGGEIGHIENLRGGREEKLGGYRGSETRWYHHTVVVLNGRVYDAFTARLGLPIEQYKDLWEYRDDIQFDF